MSKQLLLLGRLEHKSKRSFSSSRNVGRKLQKVILQVQNQSLGCFFYHKSSITFQPENSFVCRNAIEHRSLSCEMRMTRTWLSARPLTQKALNWPHITVEASFKFLKTVDIQWTPQEVQLYPYPTVYSIGAGLEIDQTSDFPLPVWISSQVVACHMCSVILTDIIQTV